ncbi:hypothetical protein [Burkholderia sp. L27(2015)]|uniref:hypothetical protein n=1 Tax=Burkholderia sp. L27(2015) TaxID=1641858 RepID=UPI00131C1F02|nr:hypothetical protein [Burkholderia sp. L27(2015)]
MSDQVKKLSSNVISEQVTGDTRQGEASPAGAPLVGPPHPRPPINIASPNHEICLEKLHGWIGAIQIEGVIERAGRVLWAKDLGVTPDCYRLYVRKIDGSLQSLSDYRTEQQALDMAERLIEVCAMVSNPDFWRCNRDYERLLASKLRRPPELAAPKNE